MLERSIADEVEAAIKAGSTEKHLDTLRQVTDLFLLSADGYSGEQIELFGDVLERLIRTVELRALADVAARIALAEMSTQLASIKQAPAAVVRRLANNDEITIARPVLTESARLTADDLVELAQTKGEQHLLAISGRWWLTEVVTDALLKRHYPSVSLRLVTNPGARMSASGYAVVLKQAETDPHLAVETGIRVDLPAEQRQQLLRSATEVVRTRLLSRAPPHLFEEIRNAIALAAAGANREMSRTRDFAAARRFVAALAKHGKLSEPVLLAFAKERKYAETVAALAELSGSDRRRDPPRHAEPARRRRADPLPRRRTELGNRRRRARQPLRLGKHGPPRTGEGERAIRQADARKRPPPAEILASPRRRRAAEDGVS